MIKSLCNLFYKSKGISVHEAVIKLKEVCAMQQEMINKYDTEIAVVKRLCRASIDKKETKQAQLYYIRKIKIIQFHQQSMRKRLLACTQKQYYLESIQLTVSHLDAIKSATDTLKHVMKQSDVEKVEQLQDNLSELISDACEIQNIVSEDINQTHDFTDEDLEKELEELTNDTKLWPEVSLQTPKQSVDIDENDIDPSTPLMLDSGVSQLSQNERVMALA